MSVLSFSLAGFSRELCSSDLTFFKWAISSQKTALHGWITLSAAYSTRHCAGTGEWRMSQAAWRWRPEPMTEWVAVFPVTLCHLWMETRMPIVLIRICIGPLVKQWNSPWQDASRKLNPLFPIHGTPACLRVVLFPWWVGSIALCPPQSWSCFGEALEPYALSSIPRVLCGSEWAIWGCTQLTATLSPQKLGSQGSSLEDHLITGERWEMEEPRSLKEGRGRVGEGTEPVGEGGDVLVSVMIFKPFWEVAGSGRAGKEQAWGTLGDRTREGGVLTQPFLPLHGRAFLFSESRRFMAEGEREGSWEWLQCWPTLEDGPPWQTLCTWVPPTEENQGLQMASFGH